MPVIVMHPHARAATAITGMISAYAARRAW
jgi:hypothetical protein